MPGTRTPFLEGKSVLVIALVPVVAIDSAGMVCARQQYRQYIWRQPALLRTLATLVKEPRRDFFFFFLCFC